MNAWLSVSLATKIASSLVHMLNFSSKIVPTVTRTVSSIAWEARVVVVERVYCGSFDGSVSTDVADSGFQGHLSPLPNTLPPSLANIWFSLG